MGAVSLGKRICALLAVSTLHTSYCWERYDPCRRRARRYGYRVRATFSTSNKEGAQVSRVKGKAGIFFSSSLARLRGAGL